LISKPSNDPISGRRNVVLGLLLLVYISSYVDRQILSILLPHIKAEFDVPDTYLGLLTGLAFAIFYTTLGLPLARIADTKSRVNLLAICIGAWSLMTVLCGMATTFIQLLFARIGVGVGEAGCNPCAHSLIADYFPLHKRATALSVYALAVPIGSLLGLALGGWLGDNFGWRVAFLAVGLPGLLLALLVKFFLKEPPRGYADRSATFDASIVEQRPALKEVFSFLWRTRSFRLLCFAAAADAFVGYGLLLWLPSYLIRLFEQTGSQIGLRLGLMVGVCGSIGILSAGILADRLGKRDPRFYCWMPAITACIALVGNIAVYTTTTLNATYFLLIIPLLVLPASGSPMFAAVQSVVPPRMRATAAAVLLLIVNLIGLGFGPTFIGFLSDVLNPRFGIEALRIAMLIAVGSYAITAILAYFASRHFVSDLAHAKSLGEQK
jgi:MFS family permease